MILLYELYNFINFITLRFKFFLVSGLYRIFAGKKIKVHFVYFAVAIKIGKNHKVRSAAAKLFIILAVSRAAY